MRYLFFLGSNQALSKAELFTTLQRDHASFQLVIEENRYLVIETGSELSPTLLYRLGGCDRIAREFAVSQKMWDAQELAPIIRPLLGNKSVIGFSAINVPIRTVTRLAMNIKKLLRTEGTKIKFILPQKTAMQMNAAQIIFNKLTHLPNHELTFIKHGNNYLLARTEQIQDIQSYEIRDTRRPSRDARIGMLPPKLAQIMLNLVPGFEKMPPLIYDPYCGMGTILQEGLLLGYRMVGSDLNQQMVEFSRNNLIWLKQNFGYRHQEAAEPPWRSDVKLFTHDTSQPFPSWLNSSIDAIVTEPYLGKPLTTPLSPHAAQTQINQLGQQYLLFFKHAQPILKNNSYVVFILPAFRQSGQPANFTTFSKKTFDEITSFGYRLIHLPSNDSPSDRGTILYSRPDALVAREITLWQKV